MHAPHHSIGGWKDFFVHLVTITVGLLIAAGIEGCVELHREHKLVQEAARRCARRFEHNSGRDENCRSKLDQQKAVMEKNIETLTRIQ